MQRELTHAEKNQIRNSRCGQCGEKPPFTDGSRCQPHRIVPGHQGGKYTRENTVSRCNKCHDIEHGGTGEAPFIGAARIGGKTGAKILHERHPDLASKTMKQTNANTPPEVRKARSKKARAHALQLNPDMCSRGGRRMHELHPGLQSKTARRVKELHPNLIHEIHARHPTLWKERMRQTWIERRDVMVCASKNARKRMAELHPDACRRGALSACHNRWHIARGIVKLGCALCAK